MAKASEEDETISPEEEAAVQQARADIAANGAISHEDARKMLGLSYHVEWCTARFPRKNFPSLRFAPERLRLSAAVLA